MENFCVIDFVSSVLSSNVLANLSPVTKKSIFQRLSIFATSIATKIENHQISMSDLLELNKLFYFCRSTEALLSAGSDDRLVLDKNGRNKYHAFCTPLNSPYIARGSCTCSSVNADSFQLADEMRVQLIQKMLASSSDNNIDTALEYSPVFNADVLGDEYEQLRIRLKRLLGFCSPENNLTKSEVIFFPSGSDAEYLPLTIALIRHLSLVQKLKETETNGGSLPCVASQSTAVYNCVVAMGEVGSGTAGAAGGKHFSPVASIAHNAVTSESTTNLRMNQYITGLPRENMSIEVGCFAPRSDVDGSVSFREDTIFQTLKDKLDSDSTLVVCVHVVCGSKTGLVTPALAPLITLRSQYLDRVIVVIDTCQFRCPFSFIQSCTQQGFICLITGSKFYCGPPFCGAVTLPDAQVQEIELHLQAYAQQEEQCVVPIGLRDYLTPFDVPYSMPNLRKYLTRTAAVDCERSSQDLLQSLLCPESSDISWPWYNPGLVLRWSCAIDSMERYHSLCERDHGKSVNLFMNEWVQRVTKLVKGHHPYLKVIDSECGGLSCLNGNVNTIVSVALQTNDPHTQQLVPLSLAEAKKFHKHLATVGVVCGSGRVATRVMIGQPVLLRPEESGLHTHLPYVVVRIALGVDMVVTSLEGNVDPQHSTHHSGYASTLREDESAVLAMGVLARQWGQQSSTAGVVHSSSTVLYNCLAVDQHLQLSSHPTSLPVRCVDHQRFINGIRQMILQSKDTLPDAFLVYDIDTLDRLVNNLVMAFDGGGSVGSGGPKYRHCFAVKACPVSYILHRMITLGCGCETASVMEIKQALRCGCEPHKIVFDSPCKTLEELMFALSVGVHCNVNSKLELDKVIKAREMLAAQGVAMLSTVGVRINPLVGGGSIESLSTATSTSKFGIVLTSESREEIKQMFIDNSFLTSLMCHVGSQGMSLDLMGEGVSILFNLSNEIDQLCVEKFGCPRISILDIGGGLTVNYQSDEITPSISDYVASIRQHCPQFFDASHHRTIITEFGKAIVTKCAAISGKVEDVLRCEDGGGSGSHIAVTHIGADVMLRTAYCPDIFAHRILVTDKDGNELAECHNAQEFVSHRRMQTSLTIAGPMCFSGDIILKHKKSYIPIPGDRVVVLDAGANTYSLFSRHCSRRAPALYVFRGNPESVGEESQSLFRCIKPTEAEASVLAFWGEAEDK